MVTSFFLLCTATLALDFSGSVTEMDTTVTLTVDITGDTIVDTGFSASK